MNKYIDIKMLKYPNLAKCNCCNRVKDIYYKVIIYNSDTENEKEIKKFIVGDLDFCKNCGNNFSKAIGNQLNPDEEVVKEFDFSNIKI